MDALVGGFSDETGGEAPGFRYAFFFDADDGADGEVALSDEGWFDLLGATVLGNPLKAKRTFFSCGEAWLG